MSTINSVTSVPYIPPVSTSSTADPSQPATVSPARQDVVELSLAGRIALDTGNGSLSNSQTQQLDSQLKTIGQQIQSGGGDVGQLQGQLSQQIYGDAHNGATIPADTTVTKAEARDFLQAGRIVNQENAGNLTSTQATQFFSQIKQIYQQSETSGATAAATNHAQNQLSAQIYEAAHP